MWVSSHSPKPCLKLICDQTFSQALPESDCVSPAVDRWTVCPALASLQLGMAAKNVVEPVWMDGGMDRRDATRSYRVFIY